MTPQEKAEEIFDNMFNQMPHPSTTNAETYIISKRCAIVAVDEIIKVLNPQNWGLEMDSAIDNISYWRKVKKELEKL